MSVAMKIHSDYPSKDQLKSQIGQMLSQQLNDWTVDGRQWDSGGLHSTASILYLCITIHCSKIWF